MVSLEKSYPQIPEPLHHGVSGKRIGSLYLRRAEHFSPPAPESRCDVNTRLPTMHAC